MKSAEFFSSAYGFSWDTLSGEVERDPGGRSKWQLERQHIPEPFYEVIQVGEHKKMTHFFFFGWVRKLR